jgi:hypothetical protein
LRLSHADEAAGQGYGDASPPSAEPAEADPLSHARARRETADYVRQMAAELAQMARARDLGLVAYFLEMAALEAETVIRTAARA